jgi:hypothetical protein
MHLIIFSVLNLRYFDFSSYIDFMVYLDIVCIFKDIAKPMYLKRQKRLIIWNRVWLKSLFECIRC